MGDIGDIDTGSPAHERLDSWKNIAAYLKRGTRTVQRWEREGGLPVHRLAHDTRGTVYAYKSELDAWWESKRVELEEQPHAEEPKLSPAAESPAGPSWTPKWLLVAALLALLIAAIVLIRRQIHSSKAADITSIAVLPFLNLTADPGKEYMSDGLTEEVIDRLTQVKGLRVVARTSVFQFKNRSSDIRKLGEQLNVQAVLEGSVRWDGNRLRVTAQFNKVADGYHLWSHTYEHEWSDVFTIEEEIAQSIVNTLRENLGPGV